MLLQKIFIDYFFSAISLNSGTLPHMPILWSQQNITPEERKRNQKPLKRPQKRLMSCWTRTKSSWKNLAIWANTWLPFLRKVYFSSIFIDNNMIIKICIIMPALTNLQPVALEIPILTRTTSCTAILWRAFNLVTYFQPKTAVDKTKYSKTCKLTTFCYFSDL